MGSERDVWSVSGGMTKSQVAGAARSRAAPLATSAKSQMRAAFIGVNLEELTG